MAFHGEEIKTLGFADDIIILYESPDLEKLLNGMDRVLEKEYKMKINKSKTKVMECRRTKSGDAGNITGSR